MPRVRFVANASWRGVHLLPGSTIDMDPVTAQAYIRAGQAVLAPDESPQTDAKDVAAILAKPPASRPGAPVETAAAPQGERRTRKPKRA